MAIKYESTKNILNYMVEHYGSFYYEHLQETLDNLGYGAAEENALLEDFINNMPPEPKLKTDVSGE